MQNIADVMIFFANSAKLPTFALPFTKPGEGGMLASASSCLPHQTSPWGRLSRFAPKPAAHLSVHNGSKSRNSVPLRNSPAGCTSSTGLLKQDGLSGPCHNGSKSRDSVPLWNPRPGRLLDVKMTAPAFSTAFACGTWFAIGESDYICRAIK